MVEPFCPKRFARQMGAILPVASRHTSSKVVLDFESRYDIYVENVDCPLATLDGNLYALILSPDIDFQDVANGNSEQPFDAPVKLEYQLLGKFVDYAHNYGIPMQFYYEWLLLANLPRNKLNMVKEFAEKNGFRAFHFNGAGYDLRGMGQMEDFDVDFSFIDRGKKDRIEFTVIWHNGDFRTYDLRMQAECFCEVLNTFRRAGHLTEKEPSVLIREGLHNFCKQKPNAC